MCTERYKCFGIISLASLKLNENGAKIAWLVNSPTKHFFQVQLLGQFSYHFKSMTSGSVTINCFRNDDEIQFAADWTMKYFDVCHQGLYKSVAEFRPKNSDTLQSYRLDDRAACFKYSIPWNFMPFQWSISSLTRVICPVIFCTMNYKNFCFRGLCDDELSFVKFSYREIILVVDIFTTDPVELVDNSEQIFWQFNEPII